MKKSKKLWFLIIFFGWAAIKSSGCFYAYQNVSDYALLTSVGFSWVYFILNIPIFFLEFSSAILLFKQKSISFFVSTSAILTEIINGFIVTIIGVFNTDSLRSFYITSREARGMTQHENSLDFMFTQQGLIGSLIIYIIFYCIIYYILSKVKNELVQ